jgi:predicted nucleic acid-binding protein
MSERFFLDTNIFVYSVDQSAPRKATIAEQLISRSLSTRKGVISYQVIQEFFNVALKRFSALMSIANAEQYLNQTFLPLFSVQSSATLYREALRLHSTVRFSWYDSLIVSAALQAKCETLYTEDLQHGQKIGSLQILNPFL